MIDNMQGLYETATECFKSGERSGAERAYRAISYQLSKLSSQQETISNSTGFHTAEQACKKAKEAFEALDKLIAADLMKTEGTA